MQLPAHPPARPGCRAGWRAAGLPAVLPAAAPAVRVHLLRVVAAPSLQVSLAASHRNSAALPACEAAHPACHRPQQGKASQALVRWTRPSQPGSPGCTYQPCFHPAVPRIIPRMPRRGATPPAARPCPAASCPPAQLLNASPPPCLLGPQDQHIVRSMAPRPQRLDRHLHPLPRHPAPAAGLPGRGRGRHRGRRRRRARPRRRAGGLCHRQVAGGLCALPQGAADRGLRPAAGAAGEWGWVPRGEGGEAARQCSMARGFRHPGGG